MQIQYVLVVFDKKDKIVKIFGPTTDNNYMKDVCDKANKNITGFRFVSYHLVDLVKLDNFLSLKHLFE